MALNHIQKNKDSVRVRVRPKIIPSKNSKQKGPLGISSRSLYLQEHLRTLQKDLIQLKSIAWTIWNVRIASYRYPLRHLEVPRQLGSQTAFPFQKIPVGDWGTSAYPPYFANSALNVRMSSLACWKDRGSGIANLYRYDERAIVSEKVSVVVDI